MDLQISEAIDRAGRCAASRYIKSALAAVAEAQRYWEACPDPKPARPDLTPDQWRECYKGGISEAIDRAGRCAASRYIESALAAVAEAQRYWEACPDPKPARPDLTSDQWRQCFNTSLAAAERNLAQNWVAGAEDAQRQAHSIWSFLNDANIPEPQRLSEDRIEDKLRSELSLPCQKATAQSGCVICIEDILPTQDESKLYCDHVYHYNCISQWAITDLRCPICRRSMDQYLVHQLTESS
jgi:hypothetical protein